MKEHTKTVAAVIATLDKIEVKGEENLNALLASIQTLKKLKGAMENEADNQ
jgi:hypothetical protein